MFRFVAAVRKLIQRQRADRIFEKYADDCFGLTENHVTPDLFVAQCKACVGMAEAAAVEHVKQQGYTKIIVEDCEMFHNSFLYMNTVYINVLKGTVVEIMYNSTTYPKKDY